MSRLHIDVQEMRGYLFTALALCLFLIAQFLPAVWVDMGAWNTSDRPPVTGYLVTAFAWPFYLSNALLFLGPLFVVVMNRFDRAKIALGILIPIYILTPIASIAFRDAILDVAVGFWVWVGSYVAATIGMALEMPQNEQANKSA